MFSEAAIREIGEAALRAGIEPALLLAVAQVESGGRSHVMVRGRAEPVIRFEGHYFDRRVAGSKRAEARAAGLASPEAGGVANPRGQAERWALFEKAARMDRKAACESVSWGLGQVMGAHWSWLGFADVEALVAEARSGTAGQVRLMLRYIEKAGLKEALAARNWARFARGYNGPGYRRNQYDRKLARAYRAYAARETPDAGDLLRIGAWGAAAERLQAMLCALGYPVAVDGVFGARTEMALKRFQKEAGLVVDGVAGDATWRALQNALPFRDLLRRLWGRLTGFWTRLQTDN
ncbi:DUF3380 domain-containing protein [Nitratireductor sp. L1-7-SE]|uniref:DUF3380 domain-containing protein n=1 Tax=Nitratireductor rhodophyticola TaxID=2854036 RepID=A0ABS7R9V2_9HYPH|nr:N-acetylmuramidase domain-containing protein [Nitratireductor rhodophyticola]MBY8917711.1 DUF3380 domain-containing protein [Nitratireductor rhodophyticola]MBY8922422.1 DUF3380 domain-containing protein [Nitratireductor rhodophyticola]